MCVVCAYRENSINSTPESAAKLDKLIEASLVDFKNRTGQSITKAEALSALADEVAAVDEIEQSLGKSIKSFPGLEELMAAIEGKGDGIQVFKLGKNGLEPSTLDDVIGNGEAIIGPPIKNEEDLRNFPVDERAAEYADDFIGGAARLASFGPKSDEEVFEMSLQNRAQTAMDILRYHNHLPKTIATDKLLEDAAKFLSEYLEDVTVEESV